MRIEQLVPGIIGAFVGVTGWRAPALAELSEAAERRREVEGAGHRAGGIRLVVTWLFR